LLTLDKALPCFCYQICSTCHSLPHPWCSVERLISKYVWPQYVSENLVILVQNYIVIFWTFV